MNEADIRPLIHKAAAHGVMLWAEDGQLRFKAGKGKLTAMLRAELQSKKRELIGELTLPVFRKRSSPPAVVQCAADRIGFWKECERDTTLRHGTHCAVRIAGPIDLERIETAFKHLILRHDLLRSSVRVAENGIPFLHLGDDPGQPPGVLDLSAGPEVSSPDHVQAAVERAIYAPFEEGQLYRGQVIKISDSEFVLVVVVHHFVVDGLSIEVIVRDLLIDLLPGQDSRILPRERPLQYADYLSGMNEWLGGPGLEYRLALWREKLRDVRGVRFPQANETQRAERSKLGDIAVLVDAELRAKLAGTVATAGVPFSIAILAANFVALARTFQRRDFFTALLYSGRDDPALIDMVGSTIGSIPMQVAIDPQMPFFEVLTRVQEAFAFATAYRIPWGLLKPLLGENGESHSVPFFNYRSLARDAGGTAPSNAQGAGMRIEPVTVKNPEQTEIVDWKCYEVHAADTGNELRINLRYMPSIYQASSLEEFADTFLRCLKTLANDPGSACGLSRHPDEPRIAR